MLFQPTNILPDIINGAGQGTVDIENDGLTVSWQINGNSKMTAYSITVFQNDAASTQLYTTGKVTSSTDSNLPASGMDSSGNVQRFTAKEITASALTAAGLSNGNEYKMQIVQYFNNASGTETSLSQKSMNVFLTRTTPTLLITAPATDTIISNDYQFTGSYSQDEGDSLEWVRWRLFKYVYAQEGDVADWDLEVMTLLSDTGNMYGVLDLDFSYNGLLNTTNFLIVLSISTENGIEVETRKAFRTSWSTSIDERITATACFLDPHSTGIDVKWGGFHNIVGNPTGDYSIENATLLLPDGSNVIWDTENGEELDIAEPWAIIGKASLKKTGVANLFKATFGDEGYVTILYNLPNRRLEVYLKDNEGVTESMTVPTMAYDSTVWFILTPTKCTIQYVYPFGGLVPSNTLVPSDILVPRDATGLSPITTSTANFSYTQEAVHSVKVSGAIDVYYLQVLSNYSISDLLTVESQGYNYDPDQTGIGSSVFLADFNGGNLDAGSFTIGGQQLTGWAIYRERKEDGTSFHLLDVPVEKSNFYDFGCAANYGTYRYVIYPIGNSKYLTVGAYTNWFEAYSDAWSIIEAEKTDVGYYRIINEYLFGKNLSSGSVSNNNSPSVSANFTRYATVQMSNANYQSGTLSAIIGHVGYAAYIIQKGDTIDAIAGRFKTTATQIINDNPQIKYPDRLTVGMLINVWFEDGDLPYFDDRKMRDDIWALSTTENTLFLKSRKGDLMEIRIAGEITFSMMDASPITPLTVSLPWVQIGDAKDLSIIGAI